MVAKYSISPGPPRVPAATPRANAPALSHPVAGSCGLTSGGVQPETSTELLTSGGDQSAIILFL